ncbi:ATP phosphoribosyltransferase [Candidatus Gracilibacteria bacterium]|nr:ATP phosphoribosyltransferase [Candidatus Gracilibacteria bacterium]
MKLTLAIQKTGRLAEDSLELLRKSGFKFEITDRSLTFSINNFPLEIIFLRADDIPEIVADRVADIGICGQNTVEEKGYKVRELEALGFGKCSLCMAYPEKQKKVSLSGKRIATSYPRLLGKFLKKQKISADIVDLSGSVELSPKLNIADCICDLVSTGSTLKNNGLVKGETIFKSEAVFISNDQISTEKQALLDKLLFRIRAVLTARKYKYIIMNAPRKNLNEIQKCIPGLKKPTIASLFADTDYVSVASVVEEDFFWTTIERLKEVGASGIIILPIEKMIL